MVHCRYSGEWWCPALPAVFALGGVKAAGRYEGLGPSIRKEPANLGRTGRDIDARQQVGLAEWAISRIISSGPGTPA